MPTGLDRFFATRVGSRMTRSKTSAAVVGRRLRRYLGALLAVGFGVAWWGFIPSAEVAAAPVEAIRPRKPRKIAKRIVTTTVAALTPAEIEARHPHPVQAQPRKPIRRPVRPPVKRPPIVIEPLNNPVDPTPITDVEPVIAPQPVVDLPEPVDISPYTRIPIRTRPS